MGRAGFAALIGACVGAGLPSPGTAGAQGVPLPPHKPPAAAASRPPLPIQTDVAGGRYRSARPESVVL